MDIAELVLDYVRALVWPALVLLLLIRFRGGIRNFLDRLAGESQELTAAGFGFEISAKFREQLATLSEQSETANPEELRQSVRQAARSLARDEFLALTSDFGDMPISARRQAAQALAEVAESMELEQLLEFADSSIAGQRVGAAIGLRVHLQRDETTRQDERVAAALARLLGDRSSLVRYRAAEAVRALPQLASRLETELRSIADTERNQQVRNMARRALSRAGLS